MGARAAHGREYALARILAGVPVEPIAQQRVVAQSAQSLKIESPNNKSSEIELSESEPADSKSSMLEPTENEPAEPQTSKRIKRSAAYWARETSLGRTRRARRIDRALIDVYPDAHCELDFTNPLELSVATILSAQCTDARVNLTTPALFARYRTAADYAGADRTQLEEMIKSTGFFRNKATSLIGLGQALVERYDGEVPGRLEELVSLPGFGRKTANVVLGNAFGVPGITVDTHLGRLARRWNWTEHDDPVKVEAQIAELIPRQNWTAMSHRVIWHGRRICHARKPACGACPIAALCPAYGQGPVDPQVAAALVKTGPAVAASL